MNPQNTSRVSLCLAVGLTLTAITPSHCQSTAATFTYAVPHPSHVTIAIDDAAGHRVRNLISDTAVTAGSHTASWDGTDDNGKPVPPGAYHWKGLTRGDLHLIYRGAFTHGDPPWMFGKTGGWLADHYDPSAIVAYKDTMIIGSGVAEWGHGLVSCDLNGKKQWGATWLSQAAWEGMASAATDGERVFATGFPGWGDNWVWEVDPTSGDSWPIVKIGHDADPSAKPPVPDRPAPFHGPMGLWVVGAHKVGPTRWDGELYVSDVLGAKPRTFVYTTARAPQSSPGDTRGYYNGGNNTWYTDPLLRTLPVKTWGLTWLPDGRCIAVLDKTLAVLNTQTGATTPLVTTGLEAPFAITSDASGRIFVSDRGGNREWDNPFASIRQTGLRTSAKASMQVKVFDASGHFLGAIGREGGQRVGPIDSNAFDMPGGVAIDSAGHLWVTEETATKRVSVWDVPANLANHPATLLHEFFGPGAYGEGAYMLDPAHPGIITSGTNKIPWAVDLNKGTFNPLAVPAKTETPGRWSSRRYDDGFPFGEAFETADGSTWFDYTHDTFQSGGKTYYWYANTVAGFGVIASRTPTGETKPLAAFGAIHNYVQQAGQYSQQWIPAAIVQAAEKLPEWPDLAKANGLDPAMTDLPHENNSWNKWPTELNFFDWTDANGDGRMQPGEITLHPLIAPHGAQLVDVDDHLSALLSVYGQLFRMTPSSLTPAGAPVYDWSQAQLASLDNVGPPSAVLPDGSQLIATPDDPVIRLVGTDQKQVWSYPSQFHGHSHRGMDDQTARVSVPGAIYGAWNLQGIVPGPAGVGDIFMLHTGTGTNHLLTTDGLYIGRLFKSIYEGTGEQTWENLPTATPGLSLDGVTLGDECFNGSIARAEATDSGFMAGHYYLLGLGRRVVVEVTGLDSVQRLAGGNVTLQPGVTEGARHLVLASLTDRWQRVEQDNTGSIPYSGGFNRNNLDYSVIENLPNHTRIALWHNERGLGFSAVTDYPLGTPHALVFTNPSTSWERDFEQGDTLDLVLGPDQASPSPADQRITFADRTGTLEAVRYRWMNAASAPAGARVLPDGREGAMAWFADLLPLTDAGVDRTDPMNWTTNAVVHATIPWAELGITYAPGLRLRADVGYAKRLPGGAGVDRHYAVSDVGNTSYDLATALELHPELWRTFALRPNGYILPPNVDTSQALARGQAISVSYRRPDAPAVIAFAGATTEISADTQALKLKYLVSNDTSPFANGGTDPTLLFKTGDACDLQIDSPTLGKCRYLFTIFQGQPVVVRYEFNAPDATPAQGVRYQAGAGSFFVPKVEQLSLLPRVTRGTDWYSLEISLPWAELGIKPKPDLSIPVEFGVLRSDESGTVTVSRTYWSSGLHGMVQDTPTEAKPTEGWGEMVLR